MSKLTALIAYISLLLVSFACLLLVMPAKLEIPNPLKKGETLTLTRPALDINILGFRFTRDLEIKQGLDIQGGTQVVLALDMKDIQGGDKDRAAETAKEIMSRRINLYGVNESMVQSIRSGNDYRLQVEIPGVQNSDDAIGLIGSTAQLEFREYKQSTQSALLASSSALFVQDFVPTDLRGKDLSRSSVVFDSQSGQPTISLEFTETGRQKFAALTKRSIGKPLAIFLDEYPITAPIVQNEIIDGKAQISGNFTPDQAKSLSITLNAGALPVPIQVIEQHTVEATLGTKAVQDSIKAGLIGVGVVMLFMILLYGEKGFISVVSLLFYGLVTLTIYKLVPITLSLAGIAGFLLSMGMAVDTNILVFERLGEEERKNPENPNLLHNAFLRAWNSIKDANMTTLITCFVLYNPLELPILHTSGVVRGFALTLALGIVINIVCGMGVTRILMEVFYKPHQRKNSPSPDALKKGTV
jgi:preprotein translocase subunit SecD